MSKIFLNILTKQQKEIFPKLKILEEKGFYLAGGTGLALQLRHRTSTDFDFYNKDHFDSSQLISLLKQAFPDKLREVDKAKDTLFVRINKIPISFFWYQYRLIAPLVKTKGPSLASLKDIAAMKLIALTSRARKRDYIDIYYLIKELGLKEMFKAGKKKYLPFNPYIVKKGLVFFDDVVEDRVKMVLFDKSLSWEKVKKGIFEKVRDYQLAMFKK